MPLAFTSQGRRRLELDQINKNNLAEIEARKQAQMQLQQNEMLQQNKVADVDRVHRQKEIFNAFKLLAINEGQTEEQAETTARNQYAKYIASNPQAATNQNMASSAIAQVAKGRAEGMLPLAGNIGGAQAQAELASARADEEEDLNRRSVAGARRVSSPMLARELDFEGIEKAKLGQTLSSAMTRYAPQLAETEAKSGIARNIGDTAKNTYESTVMGKLDPELEAQARNAGMGASRDRANLVSRSGGLVGGDVNLLDPVTTMGMMGRGGPLANFITSALMPTNAPPAVTAPGALPARKALRNLNQLNDPRFKRGY